MPATISKRKIAKATDAELEFLMGSDDEEIAEAAGDEYEKRELARIEEHYAAPC